MTNKPTVIMTKFIDFMKRQFLANVTQANFTSAAEKHTIKANFMPRKITHSENQASSKNKVITQCTQHRPCCLRGTVRPIKQFKWTEHTSMTGVATMGLDTLSASPRHTPDQTAYRDLLDAVPLLRQLRSAARPCTVASGF